MHYVSVSADKHNGKTRGTNGLDDGAFYRVKLTSDLAGLIRGFVIVGHDNNRRLGRM
jgi:hypothetical protein